LIIIVPIEDVLLISFSLRGNFSIPNKHPHFEYLTHFLLAIEFVAFFRHLRAVSYRWVARYIFGCLGWDNREPLPACIYHYLTTKFPTREAHGYAPHQQQN